MQWPREIPFEGKPEDVYDINLDYHEWLKETRIPKLLLYADPGGLVSMEQVNWTTKNFGNTQAALVGKGLRYIQEDGPIEIGTALSTWYKTL